MWEDERRTGEWERRRVEWRVGVGGQICERWIKYGLLLIRFSFGDGYTQVWMFKFKKKTAKSLKIKSTSIFSQKEIYSERIKAIQVGNWLSPKIIIFLIIETVFWNKIFLNSLICLKWKLFWQNYVVTFEQFAVTFEQSAVTLAHFVMISVQVAVFFGRAWWL